MPCPLRLAAPTLALAALLASTAPRAQETEPEAPPSPFRLSPGADAAVLAGATAAWVLPVLFEDEFAAGRCAPCDAGDLNALDRSAVGFDSRGARAVSNAGVAALPALAGLGALLDARALGGRAGLEDLVLVAESVAVSGAAAQIVKESVRRPRPYMYDAELAHSDPTFYDFSSFYSAHTAAAFAAATSFATIFTLRRPRSPWRFAVWGAGLAAASAVGVCRVVGGKHFWTDVLVGAAAGGAFGALVPALHLRRGWRRGAGPEARIVAGPSSAAVLVWF
jgi:membrane-associated phospholipid phosphatase